MPPLLPTTSPVAVAAARILAAYLSNHRLSPAEAASLGGTIVETLAGLTSKAGAVSSPLIALAGEPAPRRRARARAHSEAPAQAAPAAPGAELVLEPEPEPEPEVEPMAEFGDGPVSPPELSGASEPKALAEATDAEDRPRKRKRPSRPRSRRGQGVVPLSAAEAPSDEEPNGEPPDMGEEVTPRPRSTGTRARRVTTP